MDNMTARIFGMMSLKPAADEKPTVNVGVIQMGDFDDLQTYVVFLEYDDGRTDELEYFTEKDTDDFEAELDAEEYADDYAKTHNLERIEGVKKY